MNPWFRFYSEVLDDPKVQTLDAETFRAWVNLLCLASRNDGKLPAVPAIAFALRMSEHAVSTVLSRLLDAGLLDARQGGANGSHYAPHGWEKRQYKSDTSTERVKRFRQRSAKRSKGVTETAPDTETEVEKKDIKNPSSLPVSVHTRESETPAQVFIESHTPEWFAWQEARAFRGEKPKPAIQTRTGLGNWFPSAWPPSSELAGRNEGSLKQ